MTQSEMLNKIAELEAKVWDAHLRECDLNSKIRNQEWEFNTLLAKSRKQDRDLRDEKESKKGVEKLLSEVLEAGRKMQEERDNLKSQLEQQK
jgi:KaiC/GvpD/RAD55 family RecA-like ATPase